MAALAEEEISGWRTEELDRVTSCPVCGSSARALLHAGLVDRIFWAAPGEWSMWRCTECRSAYLDPRPNRRSIHRAYANYYTHESVEPNEPPQSPIGKLRRGIGNAYRNTRFGTRRRAIPFAASLARLLPEIRRRIDMEFRLLPRKRPSMQRVLDVGCGNGSFLKRAREAGWDVAGTEPDAKAREIARQSGIDVQASLADCLDGEPFDYATANHVIEHVHDPSEFLRDIAIRLREGGGLFLETPNIDAPTHARYGPDWRGLEPPRHLVMFNRQSLADLLRRCGFEGIGFHERYDVADFLVQQSEAVLAGLDPNTGAVRGKPRTLTTTPDIDSDDAGFEFLTVTALKGRP